MAKEKQERDIERLYGLVQEAVNQNKEVVTELKRHIVACNGLQTAAQESRKQMNQRIIEIQQTQERDARRFAKDRKKLARKVAAQNNRILKQQRNQSVALAGILLVAIGWFVEQTYFPRPVTTVTTITTDNKGTAK